jgi:hypothetical protein
LLKRIAEGVSLERILIADRLKELPERIVGTNCWNKLQRMEILRCTSGGADLWDGLDWTEEELVKQHYSKISQKLT